MHFAPLTGLGMTQHESLTFANQEAWVEVDGRKAACYTPVVDTTKKEVTCWIASEAGKTFSVKWRKHENAIDCAAKLCLDGRRAKTIWRRGQKPATFQGISTSSTTERPFIFSLLDLTDDDIYLQESSSCKEIGEIKLEVHRVTRPVCKECKRTYVARELGADKVHERAKKSTVHQVGLGDEQTKTSSSIYHSYKLMDRIVTFKFIYRPLDMLQANGITPCQPPEAAFGHKPPPQANDSTSRKREAPEMCETDIKYEPDEMFDEQEKRLLAELDRIRSAREQAVMEQLELVANKKRSLSQGGSSNKRVKRETLPLLISGEVIDLT
ncbi:hypothetical protein B0H34DRAFT_732738 [Crassisporium funariophilum]|nr:hypothetical protein B0H34DRAFT_732738 [Crassisporium funariophilum]